MDQTGTWRSADATITARREGDELIVEVGGVVHRLRRGAAPPPDDGTLFQHPTGGEMRLPRGWQVTQSQLGLTLVPPDVAMTPQGPAEVYMISTQPAPGIARVDDPDVIAHVDAALRQLIPTLSPPGPPAPCPPGVQLRWTARNPMTGAEVLAMALLQLADGTIAGIIALGERPRVEARLPALEAVFRSFRRGEGRREPQLVGVWHHWSYRGTSAAYSGASTSSETRRVMQLTPDGRVVEGSSHEGIGNFSSNVGSGWSGGYANQTGDQRAGTWTSGDGVLYIQWSDGNGNMWQYQLTGMPGNRRLTLHAQGAREPYEWNERRVEV